MLLGRRELIWRRLRGGWVAIIILERLYGKKREKWFPFYACIYGTWWPLRRLKDVFDKGVELFSGTIYSSFDIYLHCVRYLSRKTNICHQFPSGWSCKP